MTIFVFDLDDTLIEVDKKLLENSFYLELYPAKTLPTMKLFTTDLSKNKFILTNRHPACQSEIAHIFQIPIFNVLCRNYALSPIETYNVVLGFKKNNKDSIDNFFRNMIYDKINKLNNLQKLYNDKIRFYDDMKDLFEKQIKDFNLKLNRNIKILYPLK